MADEVEAIPVSTAKPGVKSTEFHLSLITTILGAVLIVIGVFKANDRLVDIGGILAGVATGGYNLSRGLAKRDTPLVENK